MAITDLIYLEKKKKKILNKKGATKIFVQFVFEIHKTQIGATMLSKIYDHLSDEEKQKMLL
ncbi:hypothetical protein BpHYR1_029651 [Brachionus plicatilis]|uniref:Uncharacterized protein n=1 Tax=Brachionus plicatilis TaxID=10195 RepID=A0A3M7PTK6_BRAPC|nr:hypothetical protein BpHYR1_029651 [Brachionus plicatilis]